MVCLCLSCTTFTAVAQQFDTPKSIPKDLRPFIEPATKLIAYQAADLNGDGRSDYVFVLEKQPRKSTDPPIEKGQRPLKIAIRLADGTLSVVKTNNNIVFCSTCGGMMGDPFESLTAATKTFSVRLSGGSRSRWAYMFKFNYSRRDNTWQLVLAEEESLDTAELDRAEEKRFTPPKDFGKIDIADFDPENYKGVGER